MRPFSIPSRLLLGSVFLLGLATCRPDDPVEPTPPPVTTGTLKVVIKPTWAGAPFRMYAEYMNVSGYRVKVEGVKFYLGDVRLHDGDGSVVVKDIEYFDLVHGGDTVTWTGMPTGTWEGLSAGLGVPQALNEANPIVYPPGHPLDLANGAYWDWQYYRFLQFDGRYDTDSSGTGPLMQPFSMHTGTNVCYMEFERALVPPLEITAGATSTLVIGMAVDRFFHSDTETLDLATEYQSHGGDPTHAIALKLTRNAVQSITME